LLLLIFSFYLPYFLVKVTPVAPTTSFAYLAIFFAFSIVPSKSTIKPSISSTEKRANDIIEREKQVAEEAKEQERIRLLQAQKQERERIDREKMRKDKETLAQRKFSSS
jgi:hypothetical protein